MDSPIEKIYKDKILSERNCSDSWESWASNVNGMCRECGTPTVDGVAAYGCNSSPVVCGTCGHASCDGGCK